MGWYATHKAFLDGVGPYGTVQESLKGESDPQRTIDVALSQISKMVSSETVVLTAEAKRRIKKYRPDWNL